MTDAAIRRPKPSSMGDALIETGHAAHPSFALYVGIWVGLLVLTTLTFGVSQVAPKTVSNAA